MSSVLFFVESNKAAERALTDVWREFVLALPSHGSNRVRGINDDLLSIHLNGVTLRVFPSRNEIRNKGLHPLDVRLLSGEGIQDYAFASDESKSHTLQPLGDAGRESELLVRRELAAIYRDRANHEWAKIITSFLIDRESCYQLLLPTFFNDDDCFP